MYFQYDKTTRKIQVISKALFGNRRNVFNQNLSFHRSSGPSSTQDLLLLDAYTFPKLIEAPFHPKKTTMIWHGMS